MHVNVTLADAESTSFLDAASATHAAAPAMLVLELKHDGQYDERFAGVVRRLSAIGEVGVEMDDSRTVIDVSLLQSLPLNFVKIPVDRLETGWAGVLPWDIYVHGDRELQWNVLRSFEVRYAQSVAMAAPMLKPDFESWIMAQTRSSVL